MSNPILTRRELARQTVAAGVLLSATLLSSALPIRAQVVDPQPADPLPVSPPPLPNPVNSQAPSPMPNTAPVTAPNTVLTVLNEGDLLTRLVPINAGYALSAAQAKEAAAQLKDYPGDFAKARAYALPDAVGPAFAADAPRRKERIK